MLDTAILPVNAGALRSPARATPSPASQHAAPRPPTRRRRLPACCRAPTSRARRVVPLLSPPRDYDSSMLLMFGQLHDGLRDGKIAADDARPATTPDR